MNGKEKCNFLKQLRNKAAKDNGIDYFSEECKFKGNCIGTCPKCEAELKELTKKINEKNNKKGIVGLGIGIAALGLVGCTDTSNLGDDIVGLVATDTSTEYSSIESNESYTEDSILDNENMHSNSECDIDNIEGDVEYIPEYSNVEDEYLNVEGDVECILDDISTSEYNSETYIEETMEDIHINEKPIRALGVAPYEP